MPIFLDFEASSLAKSSYPIEVAWVDSRGGSESWLIRPAPEWTDWDPAAELVHGLSRVRLMAEGTPVEAVAGRMMKRLSGRRVFASAPSWDGKWLSTLLRAAGLPRHALRVQDTRLAFSEAALAILRPALGDVAALSAAEAIVIEAITAAEAQPVAHRALADARREFETWRDVQQRSRAWPAGLDEAEAGERSRPS